MASRLENEKNRVCFCCFFSYTYLLKYFSLKFATVNICSKLWQPSKNPCLHFYYNKTVVHLSTILNLARIDFVLIVLLFHDNRPVTHFWVVTHLEYYT